MTADELLKENARLRELLADARLRLDASWEVRPVGLVPMEHTSWRPPSIQEALARYDAALAPDSACSDCGAPEGEDCNRDCGTPRQDEETRMLRGVDLNAEGT